MPHLERPEDAVLGVEELLGQDHVAATQAPLCLDRHPRAAAEPCAATTGRMAT